MVYLLKEIGAVHIKGKAIKWPFVGMAEAEIKTTVLNWKPGCHYSTVMR